MANRQGPRKPPRPKGQPKEIVIAPLPEAERIANRLIPQHHTHLADARVLYLSTTAKRKKCDRVRLGSAQKVGGLMRYLSTLGEAALLSENGSADKPRGFDFIVLISQADWAFMDEAKRTALVDHELAHCWQVVDDKGKARWTMRGHDVEEFTEIIARHGLWKRDLQEYAEVAARQLELPREGAPLVPEGEKVQSGELVGAGT